MSKTPTTSYKMRTKDWPLIWWCRSLQGLEKGLVWIGKKISLIELAQDDVRRGRGDSINNSLSFAIKQRREMEE